MQRPKGRPLQEGEILRDGDMYEDRPGYWRETWAAGEPVPKYDVGSYIRPDEEPDSLSSPEPAPTDGEGPAIWSLVVEDMKERDAFGRTKYGKPLRAADGRKTLRDAYQEALDLAVYLRKAIYEAEIVAALDVDTVALVADARATRWASAKEAALVSRLLDALSPGWSTSSSRLQSQAADDTLEVGRDTAGGPRAGRPCERG